MDPNPLRDPQAASASAHCDRCKGEVYADETMYQYEGRWLCSDCFKAEISAILDRDPRTLALALDLDMQRCG